VVILIGWAIWLYGLVITIQLYEIQSGLWKVRDESTEPEKGPSESEEETVAETKKGLFGRKGSDKAKKDVDYNLRLMLEDPKRAIVYMSLMVCMSFVATKVNSFLDKMWIANIGDAAVSAISTVSPIYSVVSAVGVGLGTGACVCIAYCLGRKDFTRSQALADASIFFALLLSIPTALFLVLLVDPVVGVQGEEIMMLANQYVLPLAVGCPAIILSGVLGSLFKAEGAMKMMTLSALISIPVNAILTPVFIQQFGWGITGASAATALGSVASLIVSVWLFKRGKYHFKIRFRIPKSSMIREVLTVGGPKAIEEILGGVIILAQSVLVSINAGPDALAVTGIAFSLPYLMTMIPDSLTSGAQPVCSAQAGAKDLIKMRMSMKYSVFLMLGLSLIAAVVILVFTEPILSVFGSRQSVNVDDLVFVTRLYALMMPFYLLMRMCSNMLQVVRKAHISAPANIGFGILRIIMLSFLVHGIMDAAYVEAFINVIGGIGLFLLLYHYTKVFDPEKVDNTVDRFDSLSPIGLRRRNKKHQED
jgi:putative MATE family efflux protein